MYRFANSLLNNNILELNKFKLFLYNDRSKNLDERKSYVQLVDSVKENGGDVKIFSSLHVSGERK